MIEFRTQLALKDYDCVSLAEMLRAHFVRFYPVADTERLNDAIQVASYLHRFDVRRGNRANLPNPPYIEHPLRVALRINRYFAAGDPNLVIAAILHDTVEDHPMEFADFEGVAAVTTWGSARQNALTFISKHFGYSVASIVELVSNPILPVGTSKEDKVAAYHRHVKALVDISEAALILKFSDFVDNAGSLHHHYEYNDPKAKYFIDRYSPLLEVYQEAFKARPLDDFNRSAIVNRLEDVAEQFRNFRAYLG